MLALKKRNSDVREAIVRAGLRYWMVAEKLGMSAQSFSTLLRYPLGDELKNAIMSAVDDLSMEEK